MHNNSTITLLKGSIGTFPPLFALAWHIDQWAAPAQWALGCIVPCLIAVSLGFDIKKKWRENKEQDKRDKIKNKSREYLKNKYRKKHERKHKEISKADPAFDPLDPTNRM